MEGGNTIIRLKGCQGQNPDITYEVNLATPPLGEGNMGIVRRGIMIDNKTGKNRPVAIKFLFEDLGAGAIKRSEREASIRIVHENLVEMIDFLVTEDSRGQKHYHVISELLHGVMLLDVLNNEYDPDVCKKYPQIQEQVNLFSSDRDKFAVSIVRSVLSGILTLHDNGYIHRDIDPSNIMITDTGKIKLIDLGIAKVMGEGEKKGENLTITGDFIGKPAYAAPELVRGDIAHQGKTTDIYAIGILLYQMITGSLPFTGSVNDVLKKQLEDPIPLKGIKSRQLRKIIKKATEKKQSDRYQTAAQMRVDIENLSEDGPSLPQRKIRLFISAAAVIVIVIAASIFGIIKHKQNVAEEEAYAIALADKQEQELLKSRETLKKSVFEADSLFNKGKLQEDVNYEQYLISAYNAYTACLARIKVDSTLNIYEDEVTKKIGSVISEIQATKVQFQSQSEDFKTAKEIALSELYQAKSDSLNTFLNNHNITE